MIQSFIDSWPLFSDTYLAGWCIAILLSVIGVIPVARGQVFLGAAVSQASMLGIAAAMLVGTLPVLQESHFIHSDTVLSMTAMGFAVVAAWLMGRSGAQQQDSGERLTAWIFLVAGSLAVLLLTHSPHGLEEIHRLMSSSLIGARRSDVWMLGSLCAATIGFIAWQRRHILLWIMDPPMAAACGLRTHYWALILSVVIGLGLGWSMRVAGMVYAFGGLVLPALAARHLTRSATPMFVLAPIIAVTGSVTGFVLANHYDFPPAQMTVVLWCAFVPLTWGFATLFKHQAPAVA